MLPHHRDPYIAHTTAVDTLAAAGIAAPPQWTALRDRWTDFADLPTTLTDRLAHALLDGDRPDELHTLRALALAEAGASPQDTAALNNTLRAGVLRTLRDLYAPTADTSYAAVAAQFNRHAQDFTDAASIVDPEAPAESIVTGDAKTRKAWTDSLLAAQQLTTLTPVLQAAATLTGHPIGTAETLLPLVCDPGQLHRRRVWEAWQAEGRCGHWSALHSLGATIRACPTDALTSYRQARPIEERWEKLTRGQHRRHLIDPEDQPVNA